MDTRFALCLAVLLAAPPLARAEDVSTRCLALKEIPIPGQDRPSAEDLVELGGCDSEALYYGIGDPPDPVKARKCAYQETSSESGAEIGGVVILMMVYANGKGVPRNYDLAKRFACEAGGGPGALQARLTHLEKLRTATPPRKGKEREKDFDFCDDIVSDKMARVCAAHRERIAARLRDDRREKVLATLPRTEWKALDAASKAFFDAHEQNEGNLSSATHDQWVIEERGHLEDALVDGLELLAGQKRPPGNGDFRAADAELGKLYSRIMKQEPFEHGTVTQDGIKETERVWTAYRDAFGELAGKVRPDVPADAWRAWLTQERMKMLTRFAQE